MSLWNEACDLFVQQLGEKHEDPAVIRNFLQDKATLDDVRQSAKNLKSDSDRKYGFDESRGKGISAKWIRRIMTNLDMFQSFGDAAMTAAPESIGLAWWAIRQILGAIQNDYKLYETFNAGLKDITDMMVLVRTYDKIYEGHAVKASGSIYEELYKSIREKPEKLGNVSKEVVTIQQTMREVYEFQQQSSSDWKEILSELKASKQLSHREIAVAEYEKNMQRLTPWLDGSANTMSIHLKEREDGTCSWITEITTYKAWCDSETSTILCITGEASFDKSVLGTYVCEQLGSETDHNAQVLPQYISVNTKPNNDKSDIARLIGNTLVRTIYELALDDTGDDLLLQQCNSYFSHPKQQKSKESSRGSREAGRSVRSQNAGGDNALDLSEVYPSLVEKLQKRPVLVIDGVDGLYEDVSKWQG